MCWVNIFLSALMIADGIWRIRVNADVRLPFIQISHDEYGPDYPEITEEVHLEDFFWTGSGDAPPEYLKKVHTGISKGKEVIMKTETVVATVYVDGNNEIDIPICLDCPAEDGGFLGNGKGSNSDGAQGFPPLNFSAADRRYWLLTVMSGFYTQKDNPMLEDKLARLYRLAFTRQQSRHLGINGAQQAYETVLSRGRDRLEYIEQETLTSSPSSVDVEPNEDVEVFDITTKLLGTVLGEKKPKGAPINPKSELETSSEEEPILSLSTEGTPDTTESEDYEAYVTVFPWEYIQQHGSNEKFRSEKLTSDTLSRQFRPQIPLFQESRVRVLLHNITQITEEDIEKGSFNRQADSEINTNIDRRPQANQTELIYSVFVDNRPVLAITAANDMQLVSETEAVNVIGKEIFMKAEPYLREPQATPLAPATRSGSDDFLASIQRNPALVTVSSVAILFLLLFLLALFLMGRGRRGGETNAISERTENTNELLSESRSERPTESVLDTERTNVQSRDIGIQNFSFENETEQRGEPRIHFPGPPEHRSRRSSITSSENTSDSSVYCPINPPTSDVQKFLDEKAATLFDTHKRRQHQYDRVVRREDAIYTSVVSEKKYDKNRHKKRRYLTENRVGSVETSPTQSARNMEVGDIAMESLEEDGGKYINYERTETFNPHNKYQRNKILNKKSALKVKESRGIYDEEEMRTNEAINKEIIKALKTTEKSSDTGSIGSFLSMSSVKAFPKQVMPEPLNRVLDPVFLTYYDNVDSSANKAGVQKSHHKVKERISTVATIESFPEPKQPPRQQISTASLSDNADPGVLGPVVWERHKKGMTVCNEIGKEVKNEFAAREEERQLNMKCTVRKPAHVYSPVHDPETVRHQYADLIDGALHMFSGQEDLPMPLPTRDFTNNRKALQNANRGSSAGASGTKIYITGTRPSTAQPDKTPNSNQSTVPPSPTSGVWGGSASIHGSQSPLVRPLSAGPFHRPESHDLSISSEESSSHRLSAEITAAPIIEAIQTELRKLKEHKSAQQSTDS